MASLLALLSSILWGTADFFGGKLSKKYQALAVTAVSQAFGLLTGIIIILVSSAWLKPALGWDNYFISGVLAGLFGFVGLIAFYSGLATGRMGVVSPIASLSVLIPLTIAFITGEKPNSTQILGMSIALLGAFCASGPEVKGGVAIKPVILAIIAAFGFGLAVAFIAKGSASSAIMTMTTMRFTTFFIALFLFAKYRTFGGFTKKDLPLLIGVGAADFIANLLLGVATTKGLVSLAVVLGSLFPIVTALLAFKLLHERLHKIQYLGIVFAIIGVAVISLG
ncbi:MAG: DMT family transporter [Actinobacteria bacterium]|jgi:drug/metabolite transporter (DMT)-like permease|nr:DMT family transporter [Actinomycetota bacterium]NBY82412.1 DMT family transporter [Actinomycetota bacterium]NCA25815.1 DMT family transporter [Actinomycetota bacterium]NCU96524.1 DMT family transporter [Actinomycetota bacterium]NCV73975.1 DMT family transporter [Actinomycetota bacterium]